jgi:glutamate/tyrosine decarboxylase-like PLP-dependent enzyme
MSAHDPLSMRQAPVEIDPDEFRKLGVELVGQIARHLETIRDKPVTRALEPQEARRLIDGDAALPEQGMEAGPLLEQTAKTLLDYSLFNGHPRFWGYVTSSPASIGLLGDLLASAVNPNVGAWSLAPVASEIEAQTVRWIAEFIGYPAAAGGLLVSGGNMANFVGFLAGRRAKVGPEVRAEGVVNGPLLRSYCSKETHTWIEKAAELFGHGSKSVRWIPVTAAGQIDVEALRRQVAEDRERGDQPFFVVGTAGAVATGAVDPLDEMAAFCKESDLWFHVDGAYGGLAARVHEAPRQLQALSEADSVAVDPHKWLYAPLEAGCALVRHEQVLLDAFAHEVSYYNFGDRRNYFALGPQNSRGFRALKVWLAFRQVGAAAYRQMIGEDIRLARRLFEILDARDDFEALTNHLSITTFRYRPAGMDEPQLEALNRKILDRIEASGEAFVSNAVVNGKFALRACIVNFRTRLEDVEFLPDLAARLGRELT